jgi:hypothetical protein
MVMVIGAPPQPNLPPPPFEVKKTALQRYRLIDPLSPNRALFRSLLSRAAGRHPEAARGGGRKLLSPRPEGLRGSALSTTRQGTLPGQFQVPLNALKPGRYTCPVNVIDEIAKKFEFLRAPLVVLP